jgi:hypothetical protein
VLILLLKGGERKNFDFDEGIFIIFTNETSRSPIIPGLETLSSAECVIEKRQKSLKASNAARKLFLYLGEERSGRQR